MKTFLGWWMQPMPAERLACVRIACGVYSLAYLIPRWDLFYDVSRTEDSLFAAVGLATLLPEPLAPWVADSLYWIVVLSGFLFTLGVAFRFSGPLFATSLLMLLCYRNSWSMIYHMHNALVLHACILALAGSADRWSFDALFRKRQASESSVSLRYGWPIMLIGAVTISAYFLSGVAKLVGPDGLAWARGEALRSQVAVNAIRYEVLLGESSSLLGAIYNHTWLFWLAGIGTFILELGAPLALLNRRLGKIWVVAALGMHWGIYLVMGIKFRYQLSGLCFVSFVDGEKLANARKIIDRCRTFLWTKVIKPQFQRRSRAVLMVSPFFRSRSRR